MKKFINIFLILVILGFFAGCKEAKSEKDYEKALESIKFDFDLDNLNTDAILPKQTNKYELDILWEVEKIDSDEDGYKAECASISVSDGVSTLTNKLDYDGNYDSRLFGKVTLRAIVTDSEDNNYVKEFTVTVYEKDPNLDYSITLIKAYCSLTKPTYVESVVKLMWVKEYAKNLYNLIVARNNEYILVTGVSYDKAYNLKPGDEVKVRGFCGKYNDSPIITNTEEHECTVEVINKGSYSYNDAQEIAYADFGKIKASDGSVYLNIVKFDAVIKANDTSSAYAYHIEGVNNKELVVNVSNYSFEGNDVANDKTAKRKIDNVLGKQTTITGFIFANTDGVWEVIIVPSELK